MTGNIQLSRFTAHRQRSVKGQLQRLPSRSAVPALIGRMVAADAFSHALTNPLLSPQVYHAGTFTTAGMEVIEKNATLADLLARNDVVPAGTRISMEVDGYRSLA